MTDLENIDSRLRAVEKEVKTLNRKLRVSEANLAALLSLNEITSDLRRRLSKLGLLEIALIRSLEGRFPGLAKQVVQSYSQEQTRLSAKDKSAIATLRSMLDRDQKT